MPSVSQSGAFDVNAFLSSLNNKQLMDIQEYGPDVPAGVDRGEVMRLARERLAAGQGAQTQDNWSGLDRQRYDGTMGGTYTAAQAEQVFRTNGGRLGLARDNIPAQYRDVWDKAQRGGGVTPDMNGMGDDGSQRNPWNTAAHDPDDASSWQGSSTHDRDGNPIVEWNIGQSIVADSPMEGGQAAGWNWDDFEPGAPSLEGGGGYDPNDYAFDRYVPGQESPWGVPDVEGGNKDFYRNQFMNLLSQEQGFREQQRTAQLLRDEAATNPSQGVQTDWSWIEGGLPEVDVMESGYASPLEGLEPSRGGYQEGGSPYVFNPSTGGFTLRGGGSFGGFGGF